MGKEIIISFDEEGDPVVEAKGYQGQGCRAATKPYEDALGKAVAVTVKPEIRQEASQKRTQGR